MKRATSAKILMAASYFLASAPVGAALIEADWLAPGDGLLTVDTTTGYEWLDLSQTDLADFPPGDTLEARYQSLVFETLPSGRFEGFQVATVAQTERLLLSAGVTQGTLDYAVNGGPVGVLIDLLSPTEAFPSGEGSISAALSETKVTGSSPDDFVRRVLSATRRSPESSSPLASAVIGGFHPAKTAFPNPDQPTAALLVRVPEPTTGSLLVAVFFWRAASVRRQCDTHSR